MNDKLRKIAEDNNGIIYTRDVTDNGIRREVLSELVEEGELVRLKRGVYSLKNNFVDEYLLLQLKFTQLIYSHSTSLFLHGYSNRVPNIMFITVKQGSNLHRINTEKVNVRYSNKDTFTLGLTSVRTPQGSEVRCYDLERTICDIVKDRKKIDPQIFSDAINQYFDNNKINSRLLMKYAKALNVEDEIIRYIEVLQ